MLLSAPIPRPMGAFTLTPALAGSLLVHAAVALMLVSWLTLGDRRAGADSAALAVRLVGAVLPIPDAAALREIVAPEPSSERAPLVTAPTPSESEVTAPPPAPAPTPVLAPPAVAATAVPIEHAVALGSVDVRLQDQLLLTGLPNALADRTTTEFPVEVVRLVRMQGKPVVAYPPDALAAQRQGHILAWVTVEADGSVEEIIIVDGELEFAATVEAALLTTRFEPAADRSGPIRFYTLLRFDFAGASPAAAGASGAAAEAFTP